MKAASREALESTSQRLDEILGMGSDSDVAAKTGLDLFDIADVVAKERELRVNLADSAASVEARTALVNNLFGSKVSAPAKEILEAVATANWSAPRDIKAGLIALGRRALLRGAEKQGQLGQVEDELFRLSRILNRETELTQLLTDRTAESARKRSLLASVIKDKVSMFTEALALQAIDRPEHNPIDDIASLAESAASLQDRTVAHVVTANELSDGQQAALAEKLGKIYGRAMSIHSEVDTSLLGGMTIRVGDEVIDGSTAGKVARLRASMA